MITFLALIVLSLAVFRLTRLVIEDSILEPLREKTIFKLDPRSRLRELLECPWCLSIWFAGAAVLLFWLFPVALWVALPFAISALVGLIAEHSD